MSTFELPKEFKWLSPWHPISEETFHLKWGEIAAIHVDNRLANSLVDELRREMSEGHLLYGLELRAVAYCSADPNEFLFVTDDPEKPIASVHLTWEREQNPEWPHATIYKTLDAWQTQMKRENTG